MKKRSLVFLLLFLPTFLFSDSQVQLPSFRLPDQKGQIFASDSAKGNTYFLLGCGFKDVVLCRKHGRKIYWKMQTLLKDEDKVLFSGYLNLKNAPQTVFDYILKEKDKEYESILLDKEGILSRGLTDGRSYLRVYSPKGNLIHTEYFQTVDDSKVLELFEFVKKGRRK
ncbi:hypothetical protein EHO59_03285 [Leptospira semungkisensis]|uniref:Lipoprotein n=1 Tax=Leptospira semungkisensis TaxID=2484985 RepID=A0A4R9G6C3_9LEPT|nr:hypothetical protein [Leptospira semungkisensis]TGK07146.1 hypothetical protein EHO59_03285 [Leptospira semungkisensis]